MGEKIKIRHTSKSNFISRKQKSYFLHFKRGGGKNGFFLCSCVYSTRKQGLKSTCHRGQLTNKKTASTISVLCLFSFLLFLQKTFRNKKEEILWLLFLFLTQMRFVKSKVDDDALLLFLTLPLFPPLSLTLACFLSPLALSLSSHLPFSIFLYLPLTPFFRSLFLSLPLFLPSLTPSTRTLTLSLHLTLSLSL